MKISKVSLNNVKSFKNLTDIEFANDLNILIGPNAGGKSNLIEIIQGIINDLIFVNINIVRNPEFIKLKRPYRINASPINQTLTYEKILDKFWGQEENIQEIIISLLIESTDIKNIEDIKSYKDKITNYEKEFFDSTLVTSYLNSIDFNANYNNLVGETIDIKISNRGLVEPQDVDSKPIGQFYKFFKYSNVLANFIKRYNIQMQENLQFSPYLLYIPPHRTPINLVSDEYIYDLSSNENYDIAFLKQINLSQDASADVWSLLQRKLVENYHNKNDQENNNFKSLLNDYLGLDFNITRVGPQYSLMYGISFFRLDKAGSPKLSSGEKEFLNIITNVFVHSIRRGIIIIDEPELHLHPQWQRKLIELLKRLIDELGLQLIIVTHSPHFIKTDTIKKVIRIYKNNQISQVLLPNAAQLSNTTTKDTFKILTASNNEKIFFADKVILVEGDVDRIIYEGIIKKEQDEQNNKDIIEVIDVIGKTNFVRFEQFLDIWKITRFTLADQGYIYDISTADIKKLLTESYKKLKDSLDDKSNKDTSSLIDILLKICGKNTKNDITEEDFEALKALSNYIRLRHVSLKADLNEEEGKIINKFISDMHNNNVFILRNGEIEDYFGGGKFDITKAIEIRDKILTGEIKAPDELTEIIKTVISSS